ncbi:hypothetical protein L0P88_22035 [Muricauda sp. SCSIO 64092]|nr:hypothetical protein [Muricauda sp. SCSIO 64092]UOY06589.1 hypothetical protein L0P88_22035 [Muricauda sp. SCSIO 64092]
MNTNFEEWNEDTGSFNGKNANYIQKESYAVENKRPSIKNHYDLELEKEDFSLEDFDDHLR